MKGFAHEGDQMGQRSQTCFRGLRGTFGYLPHQEIIHARFG